MYVIIVWRLFKMFHWHVVGLFIVQNWLYVDVRWSGESHVTKNKHTWAIICCDIFSIVSKNWTFVVELIFHDSFGWLAHTFHILITETQHNQKPSTLYHNNLDIINTLRNSIETLQWKHFNLPYIFQGFWTTTAH